MASVDLDFAADQRVRANELGPSPRPHRELELYAMNAHEGNRTHSRVLSSPRSSSRAIEVDHFSKAMTLIHQLNRFRSILRRPSIEGMLAWSFFATLICLFFSIKKDLRTAPDVSKYALMRSMSRITGGEFHQEFPVNSSHATPGSGTGSRTAEPSGNATQLGNITHEVSENHTIEKIEEDFHSVWTAAMAERTLKQEISHLFLSLAFIALRSDITVFLIIQLCCSVQSIIVLITVKIFLGQLSQREFARMTERGIRYTIFKLVFAGIIIPELANSPTNYPLLFWLFWFSFSAYLRVFIGGAKDRLDYLTALPRASLLSQARPLALTGLLVILVHTSAFFLWTSDSFSFTQFTICGFDLFIVQIEAFRILVRYGVHVFEQRALDSAPSDGALDSSQAVWEGKGSFLFYLDIASDLIMQACGLVHYFQIWSLRGGFRPQLVDMVLFMDVRSILLIISKKIRGLLAYRKITHQLNYDFPTKCLSPPPLPQGSNDREEEEHTCAICMEKMSSAKVLPCKHLFHLSCLRAMLQQSGPHVFVCPLCRKPLMQREGQDGQGGDRQQQRQRAERVARELHDPPTWLSYLTQVSQSLYLDVAIQVFFGFPVELEALRLRHAINQERRMQRLNSVAPMVGQNGTATALAGGLIRVEPNGGRRGARTRRLRVGNTEEEVGESEVLLHMAEEEEALDRHWHRHPSHDLETEAEGLDLTPGPVTGPSSARARSARLRARRNVAPDDPGPSDGGGFEDPEPSRGAVGDEDDDLAPMIHPPPYDEDEDGRSIWSVNVSHQVVRSIRSSIALGIWGGPAAIAWQSHQNNDQEAESPLVR